MLRSLHRAADSLDLSSSSRPPHDSPSRGRREPSPRLGAHFAQPRQARFTPSDGRGEHRDSLDGSERSFDSDPYAPESGCGSGESLSSGSRADWADPSPSSPSPFRPRLTGPCFPPHPASQDHYFYPDSNAALVASGSIGMGYGPYATREAAMNWRSGPGRGERGPWTMATDALEEEPDYDDRESMGPSRRQSYAYGREPGFTFRGARQAVGLPLRPQVAYAAHPGWHASREALVPHAPSPAGSNALPASPRKPEFYSPLLRQLDDKLHSTRAVHPALHDPEDFTWLSLRGWLNACALVLVLAALLALFVGLPIAQWVRAAPLARYGGPRGYGVGRNSTIADVPIRGLVDLDTPEGVRARVGFDGEQYELVFSDEVGCSGGFSFLCRIAPSSKWLTKLGVPLASQFNTPNRTFWPGDDPYWEAVDLHYHATDDVEYYDPDQVTTADGALVITLAKQERHGLGFVSGMIQGWNKFCYSGGGYVEVSISLPGSSAVSGLWPSAWTVSCLGGSLPAAQKKNGTPRHWITR